jgi:hypothetical protein
MTSDDTAVEYHHSGFDHYFVTAARVEIEALDAGRFAGWSRTGLTFPVMSTSHAGAAQVCRFFSSGFGAKSSHFYTPLATECEQVKRNPNWNLEGLVFAVQLPGASGTCAEGYQPLFRTYNDGQGGAPNHRYTTNAGIRGAMLGRGWIAEGSGVRGVIACVPD